MSKLLIKINGWISDFMGTDTPTLLELNDALGGKFVTYEIIPRHREYMKVLWVDSTNTFFEFLVPTMISLDGRRINVDFVTGVFDDEDTARLFIEC